MKPEQIRAISRSVAWSNGLDPALGEVIFPQFLAAINAKAEPVVLYPCGFKNLHRLVIETGAFLARNLTEDEPVTDEIRSAAMVLVGYAKDMSSLLAKQPLYTHAIEPEKTCPTCTQMIDDAAKGAAPLPDDVAKMVERFRESHCHEAADMLERLARQVPNYDGIGSLKWWKREAEQGYVEIVNRDGAIANLQAQLARQVPPDCVVAHSRNIIACRDALLSKDSDEAYHQLYWSVDWADPYNPWKECEDMIAAGQINLNQGETK